MYFSHVTHEALRKGYQQHPSLGNTQHPHTLETAAITTERDDDLPDTSLSFKNYTKVGAGLAAHGDVRNKGEINEQRVHPHIPSITSLCGRKRVCLIK